MAAQGMARLRFIRIGASQPDSVMSSAVKSVEETNQLVEWVEPDLVETSIDKNAIYVLESFDVPIFKKIAGKTRVIGPLVILAHLKYNWPLPVSRHPVFTMAMHGVTVCCTQTGEREKRTKLLELVKLMGGRTSGNFTRHVTHLIAGQVGSTKYKVARSLGTPVLRPSWVEFCWDEGCKKLIKATSEDIVSAHTCPPLSGCVISSTGFSLEGRARIRELTEQNGAEYNAHLVRDACTHLIVGDVTSKKYQYGKGWKVLCVTEQWLHQSIKNRYCMEEAEFPVEGDKGDVPSNNDVVIVEQGKPVEANPRKRTAEEKPEREMGGVKKSRVTEEDNEDDDETDLLTQYQNAKMPIVESNGIANRLFEGKRLSVNDCLSEESKSAIFRETEKRGGTIVSSLSPCDYHITSLSLPPSLPSQNTTIVTLIWLERSLAANALLDPSSHFLFTPLPVTLCDTTLQGCVITISQYDGLDREHLICLSQSLGAVVQDCFARYPSKGLLATTHLLLQEARGEKYHCASAWGVPAVSDRWLFACASAQKIVPPDEFMVKVPLPEEPHPPPDQPDDHTPVLEERGEESELAKSFHPQYDVQDVSMGVLQADGPNTQLAGMFDCNMNKALETVTDAEKEADDKNNLLVGVVIAVHRKLVARKGEFHRLVASMGGAWKPVYSKQCTHFLYQGKLSDTSRDKQLQQARNNGCTLVSPHWLLTCSQTGQREDEGLYPCNYNPNRAIPILSQKVHSIVGNEEQENKDENTPLQEQEEEEGHVEDQGEPLVPRVPRDDSTDTLKRQYEEILNMIERDQKKEKSKKSSRSQARSPSKEKSPDSNRRRLPWRFNRHGGSPPDDIHITDSQLMTVTYDHPEERMEQEKLLTLMRQRQENDLTFLPPNNNHTPQKDELGLNNDKPATPPNCDPVSHQNNPSKQIISRPHPSTRKGRQTRSMSRSETLPSTPVAPPLGMPIVTSKAETTEKALYSEGTSGRSPEQRRKPVFLLSSLNAQEKADYGALIQELGGVYYESDHFVSSCTHLVVGRASRTEKYLAGCASGKWILARTYMEACRVESKFVEEVEYEWGPQCQVPGKASALDEAPRKWREKIQSRRNDGSTGGGAFEGWRVLLCVEQAKQNGLKRLLEAGGATVVPSSLLKIDIASNKLTHAFLNTACLPSRDPQLSVEQLVAGGVHCMRPDYIAEYLQREIPPTNEQFILPDAVRITQRTKEDTA